jgi:serine phosphatase RsbU (regulator of sigma subunit)
MKRPSSVCLAKKVISIRALDRRRSRCPILRREVMIRANQDLHSDLGRAAFITALYAILEPGRGAALRRAGHERPIVVSPKDPAGRRFLESDGVALGCCRASGSGSRLEEGGVTLGPGSRVLLYTDGLVDSQSPPRQPYSRVRLLDSMRRIRPQQSAEEIVAALMEEISRHTGGGPPDDDMTAVLIARD